MPSSVDEHLNTFTKSIKNLQRKQHKQTHTHTMKKIVVAKKISPVK